MGTSNTPTILVIDDDGDLTGALTKRLTSLGFHCVAAASGALGLAAFQASRFDLIVSDLNMPGGDGVSLAETVRRTSSVPIIFVTGFRDVFKRRLRHIPNVTTLRKPFNTQDLIDLITAAVGETAAPALFAATTSENP